jgi:hypothetical protein
VAVGEAEQQPLDHLLLADDRPAIFAFNASTASRRTWSGRACITAGL